MPATLHQNLSDAAVRYAEKAFLIAVDRALTFREADEVTSAVALRFRELGIQPGDRVTLWLENGWRWVVSYFAVLRLGAIVNPTNILLTAEEVAYIVQDCGSKLVIVSNDKLGALAALVSVPIVGDRPADTPGRSNIEEFAIGSDAASRADWPECDELSVSTLCYTSGTTGRPKGAVLRHRSVVLNSAMTAVMHGRTAADIVVSALPCSHVYGNVVLNAAVLCGMTLVLLPRFDEVTALAAIQRHRATMFEGVPAMYMRLLNFKDFGTFDLTSLRVCTAGGQTMPVSTMAEVERRFGCPLLELWGMTELGGLGTTHPHRGPHRLGSIGVPLPLMEIRVVQMDDPSVEVASGEVGELVIRGPFVMSGYHGDVESTRAAIDSQGWLRTGDLVKRDADGYLFVVDRRKEVIISGGYNIYPAEVERVIAEHPAVSMIAVAAMKDELLGQVPKAFVVRRIGASCTPLDIIDHCRRSLASYKVPKAVEFLDDLPRNSTGKILRRALATSTI